MMKTLFKNWKRFVLGVVMIGLGFGFLKVLNAWVFLPYFPDLLDVSLIFFAGAVFMWDALPWSASK